MKIDHAEYSGGKLILTVPQDEGRRFAYQFKPGNYEIAKSRKKRSLDANAYAWQLITEISKATGYPKETIYRQAIAEGNHYVALNIRKDAFDDFQRTWGGRGLGWVAEPVGEYADGTYLTFAYYGSSAYDTKEMSDLIDRLIQDAKSLDIETLSDREIRLLKEEWH